MLRLTQDLERHGVPDFAWIVEHAPADGSDPVTAAWKASNDPGSMLLVVARYDVRRAVAGAAAVAKIVVAEYIPRFNQAPAKAVAAAARWAQGKKVSAEALHNAAGAAAAYMATARGIGAKDAARAAYTVAYAASHPTHTTYVAFSVDAAAHAVADGHGLGRLYQNALHAAEARFADVVRQTVVPAPKLADVLPKESR